MSPTRDDLLPPLEPCPGAILEAQERHAAELRTMGLGVQAERAERVLLALRELFTS